MPNPLRADTNDYKDWRLILLDSDEPKSPMFVTQEDYDSALPTCRMRVCFL